MRKIMLIRHGEKHNHGDRDQGITADGRRSTHELTVRGWQRAAALVGYFAPPGGIHKSPHVKTPRSIFASDATRDSPSKRAMHTVAPLAEMLGIEINHDYEADEEDAVAAAVLAAPSPVLVVWHHSNLPSLTRRIAGGSIVCPAEWPDDRFDVTWILDCSGDHTGSWTFSQVAQCLLPGDRPEIF